MSFKKEYRRRWKKEKRRKYKRKREERQNVKQAKHFCSEEEVTMKKLRRESRV
jgi:hypothetical protein